MFAQRIEPTKICSVALDSVFNKILCDSYNNDYALKALARTLLGERIGDAPVCFCHLRKSVFNDLVLNNTVSICSTNDESDFADFASAAASKGYTKNERFDAFFRSFKFGLWTNKNIKSTVILYEYGGNQIYHNILSAFKWFVPWYFEGEQSLKPEEIAILRTFTKEDGASEFVRLIDSYYDGKDYRNQIIQSKLQGIEKKLMKRRAASIDGNISECRNTIETYQSRIDTELRKIREFEIQRLGYLAAEEQKDDRILNMFLMYKNLYLGRVRDSSIEYTVRSKVTNFSSDLYKDCTRSERSYIYEVSPEGYETTKRIFDAIFLEKKYSIYMFGAFEFKFENTIKLKDGWGEKEATVNAMPNPHIYYFACSGSFGHDINDAMVRGDFEEAIEVTIAETGNVNFSDSAPVQKFVRDFFGDYRRVPCIECSDGRFITPDELITTIKEEM